MSGIGKGSLMPSWTIADAGTGIRRQGPLGSFFGMRTGPYVAGSPGT